MTGSRAPLAGLFGPGAGSAAVPCAPTLLRWHLRRLAGLKDGGSALQAVPVALRPLVLMRSGNLLQMIERAQDAEDLIALAPEAVGPAEPAWHLRLRRFGPSVVPLLAHALRKSPLLHGERRNVFVEHLVPAFYWFGDAGAASLLNCLPDLDDYGKSQSCVVLGMLGHRPAADPMAAFLLQSLETRDEPERLYVGPLWGLIDLDDARAADGLADLVLAARWFFELPDFVALAGDLRCVEPTMLALARESGNEERRRLMMALAAILKRTGLSGFCDEATKAVGVENGAEAAGFAQDLAEKLAPQADAYLEAIRHG